MPSWRVDDFLQPGHRWLSASITAPVRAGLVYALVVFAVGFALGAIRIWLVAPRFGATIAVLIEAPFMLAASWWVCLKCTARFRVSACVRARLLMGLVAFATLLAAEIGLAAVAFGQSPADYMLRLRSLPAAIGLWAQIAFASFPLLQAGARRVGGQEGGHP
jgi:hypothetical protein